MLGAWQVVLAPPRVCEGCGRREDAPKMPCPGTCEVTFCGQVGFADGIEVKDIEKGRVF